MLDESIEYLCTYLGGASIGDLFEPAKIRKLLSERKGAGRNTLPDSLDVLTRAVQAGFCGRSLQAGAVSHTFEFEVEPDSVSTRDGRAARSGFPAH
jgi:hypothetical protein